MSFTVYFFTLLALTLGVLAFVIINGIKNFNKTPNVPDSEIQEILAMNSDPEFFTWLYSKYKIPEWQYQMMNFNQRMMYYRWYKKGENK